MMIVLSIMLPLRARYICRSLSFDMTEGKTRVGFFHLLGRFESKESIVCGVRVSTVQDRI